MHSVDLPLIIYCELALSFLGNWSHLEDWVIGYLTTALTHAEQGYARRMLFNPAAGCWRDLVNFLHCHYNHGKHGRRWETSCLWACFSRLLRQLKIKIITKFLNMAVFIDLVFFSCFSWLKFEEIDGGVDSCIYLQRLLFLSLFPHL